MQNDHQYSELRDKIMKGITLAVKKLYDQSKKNHEPLVISVNNKVKKIYPR